MLKILGSYNTFFYTKNMNTTGGNHSRIEFEESETVLQ